MANGICGQTCSISVAGGTAFNGHKWTTSINGEPIDTRKFGDGPWGSWLACIKSGEVVVSSYLPIPNLQVGSTAALILTQPGGITISNNTAICVDYKDDVDAKKEVGYDYTFKLSGVVTGM